MKAGECDGREDLEAMRLPRHQLFRQAAPP